VELTATEIVALHDAALARWNETAGMPDAARETPAAEPPAGSAPGAAAGGLAHLVEAGHLANLMIWRLEDEARRRDVGDARIAAVKRAIDPWNQRRNDLMEEIDARIVESFAKVDTGQAELHSESAGMIIDRLSILALKIGNMERIAGDAASEGDRGLEQECTARAAVLRAQRDDLAACLARLARDFAAGRRYFKVWRQMKAYNDARLNAALRAVAREGT